MSNAMWHEGPTVFTIDRDPVFCRTLSRAVEGLRLPVEFFPSCQEFLETVDSSRRGCVAIDPAVPRCNVAELLAKLTQRGICLPAVIVSACGEISCVVEAMRAGALNYLEKPCPAEALAAALQEAVAWDARHGRALVEAASIRRRLSRLSPEEHRVLEMLVEGMTNEEVAAALGRSVRTIEGRRARIREKMRAKGLADLICQSVAAGNTAHDRRPQGASAMRD